MLSTLGSTRFPSFFPATSPYARTLNYERSRIIKKGEKAFRFSYNSIAIYSINIFVFPIKMNIITVFLSFRKPYMLYYSIMCVCVCVDIEDIYIYVEDRNYGNIYTSITIT